MRKYSLLIKNKINKDTKTSTCQIYCRVKPLSVDSAHFQANDRPITPLIIAFCRSVRLCRNQASRDQLNVLIQATHVHTAKKEDDQTKLLCLQGTLEGAANAMGLMAAPLSFEICLEE